MTSEHHAINADVKTLLIQTPKTKCQVLFLTFAERLSPRHSLLKSYFQGLSFSVKSICWRRKVKIEQDAEPEGEQIELEAPWGSFQLLKHLPFLWRHLNRRISLLTPEVIILGHFFLLPLALFLKFRSISWRPVVIYDSIEQFPEHLSGYFGNFRLAGQLILKLFENLSVMFCDAVLCVDSLEDRTEQRLRRWNKNTLMLWNVPSLKEDPLPERIETLRFSYAGHKSVAFVGGLMPEKGIRCALSAAGRLLTTFPDILFVFIGPMMEDVKALKNIIKNNGIEGNVRILPQIPYIEMQAHLANCLLAVAPHQQHPYHCRLSAGNGRKFFAYMQAGLPIIGPELGEIGEAVRMADCGVLVDTENASAIADAVAFLLTHPEAAKKLGENGRWAFENHFNWEVESSQLPNLLNKIGLL